MSERYKSQDELDGFLESSEDEREAPDSFRGNPEFSQAKLDKRAAYWVAQYGGEGLDFTKEQEAQLATLIQQGIAVCQRAENGEVSLTAQERQIIRDGERAERALIESNLRFAFMYARESIGLQHVGVYERMTNSEAGSGTRVRRLGTYRPLSSARTPRASLEDRYSMAAIGLIKAARNFLPKERDKRTARFIGFAAWTIQQEIDRGVEQSEHAGVRLPSQVQAKLNQYFAAYPAVTPDHKVPADVERLLQVTEPRIFPDDAGHVVEGGVDDLRDPWGEDDRPDSLQDIWDDPNGRIESGLVDEFVGDSIDTTFSTLSEREAGVIRLRFGIGRCACHDEVALQHTNDETGKVYGVTQERIRQLESKIMSKLRDPSRSDLIRDALEFSEEVEQAAPYTLWRGDAVQLERTVAEHLSGSEYHQDISNLPPVIDEVKFAVWQERQNWLRLQATRNKRWQAFAEEEWDEPVRGLPFEATAELVAKLTESFSQMEARYFSRTFTEQLETSVPMQPLSQFNEVLGRGVLTAQQISHLWNAFMTDTFSRLQNELEDNFNADRVGQLFSRIISENINDNDSVLELRIPKNASGRIGYLASNLGLGRISIIGNAGHHVAAWNHGYADVTVQGNVGDEAGALLRDSARLYVAGCAGHKLAIGARDEAEISVLSALSIGQASETVAIIERGKLANGY